MASATHMATTTLRVGGMTCGACTSAVESAFKNIHGAGSVSVSLVMERAVVQHNPQLLSPEKVQEMIEDRGFDAEVLATDVPSVSAPPSIGQGTTGDNASSLSTTTLAVEGMTCGACTSAVEGGFKNVPGIKSMSISLLSERAVVEHDSSIITPEAIAEIIEDKGFGAEVLETQISPALSLQRTKYQNSDPSQIDLTTTTVAIEGMTCGACTSAVEGGFKDIQGLVQFNISLLAERAVIIHDPVRLSPKQIAEIIEDRGFDAKILSSQRGSAEQSTATRNVHLKVFGLPTSSAATALEDALRLLPGVSSAVVHLATSRVNVTHNPSLTGLRVLVEAIENLGYNALLADADDNNAQLESLAKTREIQEWRRAFWYSLSFAVPVFVISMAIPMIIPRLDFGSFLLWIPGLYLGDVICLVLTVPVQFGIGKRFYISSYKSLKHGSPTMDVLVTLGTSAAFFFSVVAVLVSVFVPPHSRPGTFFETSSMLITFITLGRYLENRAKGQTSKALSRLMSLAPSMATIYADPIAADKAAEEWDAAIPSGLAEKRGGPISHDQSSNAAEEKIIPTELIEVGDIVILRPGGQVPADGIVTRGQSYLNESMVTGEAVEILKRPGSELMAGTVNGTGRIDFRVTRAGRDTQLSQIVKLVQEAQTSRAPIQRMADIVAGYFVPTIIILGLLTFISWMILSHVLPPSETPEIFLKPESGGKFMVCLKLCISVIVFACPCALGLSTPTAVMVGTGVGAEQGILVKGGAALEIATKVTHVVFDKTGTLTIGKMSVPEVQLEHIWGANDWRRKLWWSLIGLAEMGSEHPIGRAILDAAKLELNIGSEGMIDGSVGDFEATVGKGICASVEPATSAMPKRYKVHVGNLDYLNSQGIVLPTDFVATSPIKADSGTSKAPSSGTTQIYVAIDNAYAGVLSLSDTIKPSAAATVTALNRMSITCSLVTGDQYSTAAAVAARVGIPKANIHAGISPDQKQNIIKQIQEQGTTVAMVGDGINDSPALATANIGIALSSGTDVAMEAADIVLMRPEDMLSVAASLSLSRKIFNRIRMNLIWACLYNLIGLPFAMGFGLMLPGHIMMPPMAAGAAMAASSVSVVGSSLFLKFWKRPQWMTVEKLEMEGPKSESLKGMSMTNDRGSTDRLGMKWAKSLINRILRVRSKTDDGYLLLQEVEAV